MRRWVFFALCVATVAVEDSVNEDSYLPASQKEAAQQRPKSEPQQPVSSSDASNGENKEDSVVIGADVLKNLAHQLKDVAGGGKINAMTFEVNLNGVRDSNVLRKKVDTHTQLVEDLSEDILDSSDPPLPPEIEYVAGCPEDQVKPHSFARGCPVDGAIRLTIRGRRFGHFGARVLLERVGPIGRRHHLSDQNRNQMSLENALVICPEVEHSKLLPSLLLFCELPAGSAGSKYHVRVVAGSYQQKEPFADEYFGSGMAHPSGERRDGLNEIHSESESIAVQDRRGHDGGQAILRSALQYAARKPDGISSKSEDGTAISKLTSSELRRLGVGGLGKQVASLLRRAFASRAPKASKLVQQLGLSHVKGVLLHGPPGTGKTLIARTIGKLLDARHVHVVNGPELMSKYVGDSERNIRELFEPAAADFREFGALRAPLHILILDEADSILRPRGSGDESAARAVYDGVTTQMLAHMDGVDAVPNVLVIALTNRMDGLDRALLRPGRFEVQLRFPLPDAAGRLEILGIHTSPLQKHNRLASNVNLQLLASETPALSGADIAGAVRSAVSFALMRASNRDTLGHKERDSVKAKGCGADVPNVMCSARLEEEDTIENVKSEERQMEFSVTMADLRRGITEVVAAKGAAAASSPHMPHGITEYNSDVLKRARWLSGLGHRLRASRGAMKMARAVIHGPAGSGLTATAAFAVHTAGCDNIQFLTPDVYGPLGVAERAERIKAAFDAATHGASGTLTCVVIDGLEVLLECGAGSGGANKHLLNELQALMRPRPPLLDARGVGRMAVGDQRRSSQKTEANGERPLMGSGVFVSGRTASEKDASSSDSTGAASEGGGRPAKVSLGAMGDKLRQAAGAGLDVDGSGPDVDDGETAVGAALVLVTASDGECLREFDSGGSLFDSAEELRPLGRAEAAGVIMQYGAAPDIEAARRVTARLPPAIPIRRLLYWIESARAAQADRRNGANDPTSAASWTNSAGTDADVDETWGWAPLRPRDDLAPATDAEGQTLRPVVSVDALVDQLDGFGILADGEY